jgi:hypothetical protein
MSSVETYPDVPLQRATEASPRPMALRVAFARWRFDPRINYWRP